jgi:hypothetical protein
VLVAMAVITIVRRARRARLAADRQALMEPGQRSDSTGNLS